MNFIYVIVLFLSICLSAFGINTQTTSNTFCHDLSIGISVLSGLVSLICIICMVFNNILTKDMAKKLFNSIRNKREYIKTRLVDLERYKSELQNSLTKLYPDYEKELFKSMNPSDGEHLSAILVKYPELKFNGILTEYTKGINCRLVEISNLEREISDNLRDIEDIKVDGWRFGNLKVPSDITSK